MSRIRKRYFGKVTTIAIVVAMVFALAIASIPAFAAPGGQGMAAPAIANDLLKEAASLGVNNHGYYISMVARQMDKDASRAEIKAFLADLGVEFSTVSISSLKGEKVNVLIGFEGRADAAVQRSNNKKAVEDLGGEIYAEFTMVNVIAANIPEQAIRGLENHPGVRYVEPDVEVFAIEQTVPWGIDRVFGDGAAEPNATWEKSKGLGIGVAVLDTGIDVDHEDLNVVGGRRFYITGLRLRNDSNYNDVHGHGTHVAGTIAAKDNGYGVVGVAPALDLYAVKVLDDLGNGSISSIVAGLEWAYNNPKVSIVNMSLGASTYSKTFEDACNAAYNGGLLIVSSAGNTGNASGTGDNVGYPAKFASVIAVAASDSMDRRADFSSTGPAVELIAPGVNILSTIPNDGYQGGWSGTSMASPHVAGAAALIWAADPKLTNIQVREILQDTAVKLKDPTNNEELPAAYQGYGLVRADFAVARVLDNGETTTYTITATAGDNGSINPAGSVVVEKGTTQTFTITPDEGYTISGVQVDGQPVTVVDRQYTFTNVTANHTIYATFTSEIIEPPVPNEFEVKITTDQPSYIWNTFATINVKVSEKDDPSVAIEGAVVKVTVQIGSGTTYQGTTNSDGIFTARYRVANRTPVGDYNVTAEVTKGDITKSASTTFGVSGK